MARYIMLGAFCALVFAGVLAGFGFIIAAAYSGLAEVVQDAWAMLIVGAALIVLCLLDGLLIWALTRRDGLIGARKSERSGPAEKPEQGQSNAQMAQALADELLKTVERHPKEAGLAALGLGLALGASPGLRRQLSRLLD
ncbi:MAG: hypothetical protein R3316_04750 [Rhodovibrionaceae bacterium]|nr:hypothetical protein [Rhodovibrionaceae bacterium]